MEASKLVKYLKHHDIDTDKWDNCVDQAGNCRIYAYSWYLDRTAVKWDAIVFGDYQYVMPLPVRSKWGIKYVFQPMFSQQLGVFPHPPEKILQAFLLLLEKEFRFVDTQLNSEQIKNFKSESFKWSVRDNFLLQMGRGYKAAALEFSKNTKRNIAKAQNNDLQLVVGLSLENYLDFKGKYLPSGVDKGSMAILKNLIAFGQYKGFGEIWGVYSGYNELTAAVCFCRWKNRIIYMNAVSNDAGKELKSMFFLIDSFIQKYSDHNLILDFEGSMIPGVARFFEGFGANPENYYKLGLNRLPWPLKWVKR